MKRESIALVFVLAFCGSLCLAQTECRKPNVGKEYPMTTLPTSDEFEWRGWGMQWSWNHYVLNHQ